MNWESLELIKVDEASAGIAGVVEVTIDRPKALNAINAQVLDELSRTFSHLAEREDLRAVILTGAGKAFVAGADIAAMADMTDTQAQTFSKLGHDIFAAIEALPVPVIGAINGFALGGGCELALCCDMLLASEKAKFGQPEVKLGLIPGFGGCVRLPRKIGPAAASAWIFSAEIKDAHEARRLGLVLDVFAPDELMGAARKLAGQIAAQSPVAVRASKRVIQQGLALSQPEACTLEQERFGQMFTTEDMREGTRAFIEKRTPNFLGK